ncbi:hypothetical protein [Sporisorium scitamineum]|uniref:Uncharacterized protein n=1 Tax=Sporisorium scitamineum TaxID=49012 RepID=A0A0F7RYN4_9BASI|nr:hypothetical protein [Sporisorium scitamineum]
MVYLCGLGYRCRRASGRHARKGSGDADEVEAGEEDAEGDVTIRPRTFWPEPAAFEDLLGEDFSYLVDQELMIDESEDVQESRKSAAVGVTESGLMTPPLTTPELGLDGAKR